MMQSQPQQVSETSHETPTREPDVEMVDVTEVGEETPAVELCNPSLRAVTVAIRHEIALALKYTWLGTVALRTSNIRLEKIWLPFIIDGAFMVSGSSEAEVRWQIPDRLQPLYAGRVLTVPRRQAIINRLITNTDVAHFLLLALSVEIQHAHVAQAYARKQLDWVIDQVPESADRIRDWFPILAEHIKTMGGTHELIDEQIMRKHQQLMFERQQQLLLDHSAEPPPPSSLFVLLTTFEVDTIKPSHDMENFENLFPAACSNLERLEAEARVAFRVIEENGVAIRNELRAGLTDTAIPRSRGELLPPMPYLHRMVSRRRNERDLSPSQEPVTLPTSLSSQLPQQRQRSRSELVRRSYLQRRPPPPSVHVVTPELRQRLEENLQPEEQGEPSPSLQPGAGAAHIQRYMNSLRNNRLRQPVPVIRPLRRPAISLPSLPVNPIREYVPLSHWEQLGRRGQIQMTFRKAISELDYRIENVQILQEELSQCFNNVSPRIETRIRHISGLLQPLMDEEYERVHGRRANVAQYHIELHGALLRERIIVVDRNYWPKEVTMSRMRSLEIWLQSLRSDFIHAAPVYGSGESIKYSWAYPPWPAEMESLSLREVKAEVNGILTDIELLVFDPVW